MKNSIILKVAALSMLGMYAAESVAMFEALRNNTQFGITLSFDQLKKSWCAKPKVVVPTSTLGVATSTAMAYKQGSKSEGTLGDIGALVVSTVAGTAVAVGSEAVTNIALEAYEERNNLSLEKMRQITVDEFTSQFNQPEKIASQALLCAAGSVAGLKNAPTILKRQIATLEKQNSKKENGIDKLKMNICILSAKKSLTKDPIEVASIETQIAANLVAIKQIECHATEQSGHIMDVNAVRRTFNPTGPSLIKLNAQKELSSALKVLSNAIIAERAALATPEKEKIDPLYAHLQSLKELNIAILNLEKKVVKEQAIAAKARALAAEERTTMLEAKMNSQLRRNSLPSNPTATTNFKQKPTQASDREKLLLRAAENAGHNA